MCIGLAVTTGAAAELGGGVPDLTKGGELIRINKRWVGPVGIFCGSWRPRQGSDEQKHVRQLLVLEVEKGSPADGVLAEGDVILGADGTGASDVPMFESAEWAMIPIADAITEAEARDPAILKLLRWRQGKTETVTIKLETLGRYSDTAPYHCEKSKRILRKGIKALYESNDPGKFSMGVLCLLAADDPASPDNEKIQARAKEWARKLIIPPDQEVNLGAWESGVELIVLAEYYMKTRDEAVFPTLVKRAEHHARGVSWFGTTGHRFADKKPDGSDGGRIGGYGPINCSGIQGFLGLSLARKAGVDSPAVDAAIERAQIFFGHYAFKSGIGYGEHFYGLGGGRDDRNGVHAMSALALGLQQGKEEKAKYFTALAAVSTYSSRQYAHGGPFFGQVWQPVGAGQGGVKAANMQFKEIRWHLDLKRRWDHQRIYDPTNNKYGNSHIATGDDFSYAATALLFYALPLKQLYITGRDQKDALQFSDADFAELLFTKNFDPSNASTTQLLAALSRSHGMLRGEAGGELARRVKATPDSEAWLALMDKLLAMATDPDAGPIPRTGACATLMYIKSRNSTATATLKNEEIAKAMVGLLKDGDPYVRFAGVRVLQSLNPDDVKPYVNDILHAVVATQRPTFPLDQEDPLQAAHSIMGELLFKELLNDSMDGVDREKLIAAIRSLLETPNAIGRVWASRALSKLTEEEILEIADVLVDNGIYPPPANAMSGTPAPNVLAALAQYRFEETLPLAVEYDNGGGAGVQFAIKRNIPQVFGQAALRMSSACDLMRSLGDLMLVKAIDVTGAIDAIENVAAPEQLNKLKRIHAIAAADPTLTLPAVKTELVVDATNYAIRSEHETSYTWRKVYGAGKVDFTPNATGQSNKTTVSFTDHKPGKYRFEVTMSDALGINVLRKTVDVTLYDQRGKLPANRPPQAKSQTLTAVPGLPESVRLSGADPDGDDLGFIVTQPPAHGRLSGVGGDLTYTADFGHSGMDQFTFEAIDGQGMTATGTVEFKVSDQNVGVVVYEGFDYPEGALHGRGGSPSFGFNGPWTNTKGTKDSYLVADSSLSYPDLPSTGGKLTKGKGWWPCSRPLDVEALSAHKLLNDGRELWFSVVVGGQKGRQKFSFGLRGGDGEDRADLGFGFDGPDIFATKDGEKTGTSRVGWSRTKHVMFPDNAPNMIIGRCVWGKTAKDRDTLEIYRVFDAPVFGPLVLKEPVCVVEAVIPQGTINSVYITDTAGGVDEIRIGPTLHSVMIGTKPLVAKSEKPDSKN